jgi:hypothetical protein
VQTSQDNSDYVVKKLENGSTTTCTKLSQINLKKSYQKMDKPNIKKKAHAKCFECSTLNTFHPNVPIRKLAKQSSLEDTEAYLKEDALLAKKKSTKLLTIQKKK